MMQKGEQLSHDSAPLQLIYNNTRITVRTALAVLGRKEEKRQDGLHDLYQTSRLPLQSMSIVPGQHAS